MITKFSMNDHQNFNFKKYLKITKINLKITNYFIDFFHQIQWNFNQNVTQNHQNIFYFLITKLPYLITKMIYLRDNIISTPN